MVKRLHLSGDSAPATTGLAVIVFFLLAPQMAPFMPWMPNADLDPSWCWATNEAVAKGLAFGRQFIFQTGPYSAIYNGSYHPATYSIMLGGGLFLASALTLSLILLSRENKIVSLLAILAITLTILRHGDAKFYFLTLVIALATIRAAISYQQAATEYEILVYNWASLPLISFVKGSFCLYVLASVAICLACLAIYKRRRLFVSLVVSLLLSSAFFWLLAGQQLTGLPGYYHSVFAISASYTGGMAGPSMFWQEAGFLRDLLHFIGAATLALAALPFLNKQFSAAAVCRWLLLALFLFLSFKGGFVRHARHAIIAMVALYLLALAIPLTQALHDRKRQALAAAIMALCLIISWLMLPSEIRRNFFAFQYIAKSYQSLSEHLKDPSLSAKRFEKGRRLLHAAMPLPTLPGTSDIYSYNQGYLFASENTWNPRPVIQSFSAYDKRLAAINRAHLLGPNAPDNIFFAVQAIDNRLPALEDGASWPALWSRYRLDGRTGGYLILRKKAVSALPPSKPLAEFSGALGKTVTISDSSRPVLAEISVKPTALGKLLNIIFKPPELAIVLQTSADGIRTHRFIAAMAETPFLISPYVANTKDFAYITRFIQNNGQNDQNADAFSTVKYFSINVEGGKLAELSWHKEINIKLLTLDTPSLAATSPPLSPPLSTEAGASRLCPSR